MKLIGIVDHDITQADFHGITDLRRGFVVAVEKDLLGGKIYGNSSVKLSAGYHVDEHPFLFGNAIHLLETAGLACEQRMGVFSQVGLHAADIFSAALTNTVLVHQVQRGAVLICHFHRIDTGKFQMILVVYIQIGVEHLSSSLRII